MPSFRSAFPSRYLKADDLGTKRPVVTIETVSTQQVGSGADAETKLVVEFKEPTIKPLVLNKINAETIAEIAETEDYDEWPGVSLQLGVTRVEFQGKRVPAIRISSAPLAPKPSGGEDDVPF